MRSSEKAEPGRLVQIDKWHSCAHCGKQFHAGQRAVSAGGHHTQLKHYHLSCYALLTEDGTEELK